MEDQTQQQKLETATNQAKTYLEYRRWIRNRTGLSEISDSQLEVLLLCEAYRDSKDFRVTLKVIAKVFQRPFSSPTAYIKGLIKEGLVEYEPLERKRGKSIRLTDLGLQRYRGVVLGFQAKIRDMPIDDNSEDYII